jgi:hypothetical protein
MKERTASPATLPLDLGDSSAPRQFPTPNGGVQDPTPNKEYPRRKDRAESPATPPLGLGDSLLDIGHSSPKIRYVR